MAPISQFLIISTFQFPIISRWPTSLHSGIRCSLLDSGQHLVVAAWAGTGASQREFFIDNLLVRIHFFIVIIRWTGLAPWEFGPRNLIVAAWEATGARALTACCVGGSGFRVGGSGSYLRLVDLCITQL